jgi:hypothetical protein
MARNAVARTERSASASPSCTRTLQAQSGTLTGTELNELDSYRRVGHLLDLMHSKARRSLQGKSSAA